LSHTIKENIMPLYTDHSFHIGEQHLRTGKPNQDYALSGLINNERAYAIVSDGCSSGGHTDIGARLVTLATKRAITSTILEDSFDLTQVKMLSIKHLIETGEALALTTNDMLATAVVAVANTAGSVSCYIFGDGVIAKQDHSGAILATRFRWEKNAPFYPAYQGELRKQFSLLQSAEPALTCEWWKITDDEIALLATGSIRGARGMEGIDLRHEPPTSIPDLAHVAVFSDGVEQVDGMDWQQVVRKLLAFKTTNGQFATRRMNRFLSEARKTGRGPLDDIAMAVIHFG
jgi:hypothetical protein